MFIWSDMIRLNICKNTKIENKSLSSVKHQSLGGNFHNHTVTAGFCHLMEIFLNHIRLRCCVLCRNHFVTDDRFNGSDQSHFISGIFQNRFYHIRSGCFSFCSCDTDCFQFLCGMSEICGRNKRHRISCIFHKNDCHIFRCFHSFFHDQNLCSFCNYIRHKFMAIHHCTADTDKKRALFYFPGIINHIFYFLVCTALKTCIFQLFQ